MKPLGHYHFYINQSYALEYELFKMSPYLLFLMLNNMRITDMNHSFQIKAYLEADLLGPYFFMISHIVLDYKLQSNQLLGTRLKGYKLYIRAHRNNY